VLAIRDFCTASSDCNPADVFGLSNDVLDRLHDLFNFQRLHSFVPTTDAGFDSLADDYLKDSISSGGAVLVSEVIHNMSKIIHANTSVVNHTKYILFAGHDDAILFNIAYLSSINLSGKIILSGNPGYGADLSFRLYKFGHEYNVVVGYRNFYADHDEVIIYKGGFDDFQKTYFNQEQLDRQLVKKCNYL